MGKTNQNEKGNLNAALCDMLNELADYEKNISRNIHKYNAYRKAAQVLASYPKKITSGKEAQKLHGIGKKIADKIDEFLASGKLDKLEKIRKNEKFKIIQLLTRVSGIGPKKARELAEKGVKTIEDLKKFQNELTHHQQIGLKYFYDLEKRIPRDEVFNIELTLTELIAKVDKNCIITICGSYRRGKPTTGDIDCLLTHPKYTSKSASSKHENLLKEIVEKLTNYGLVVDTMALGATKFMGVCKINASQPARRLDIRLTYMDEYYCSLLYFTGSALFNQNMRAHALEKGFTLNEYSLRPVGITGVPGEPVPITSEREIFDYMSYPYKKPEERDF